MTPTNKLQTLRTIPGDIMSPFLLAYDDDIPPFALTEQVLSVAHQAAPYAIVSSLPLSVTASYDDLHAMKQFFDVILERVTSSLYPLPGDAYEQERLTKQSLDTLAAAVITAMPECDEWSPGYRLSVRPKYVGGESGFYQIGRKAHTGYGLTIPFVCEFWR